MGFWKTAMTFANCPICGKGCNAARIPVQKNGNTYFLHFACAQQFKAIYGESTDYPATEQEIKDMMNPNTEFRKKCNVCGKVYCFSGSDIRNNIALQKQARSAAGNALLQSLGGTTIAASTELNRSDNLSAQIRDFNKCPYCNSSNIVDLTEEQFKEEQKKLQSYSAPAISAADELKKFKELLDSGVITQEEFDAKKKQLLGL